MAQLNSLIGSILRDVIRAQHEANLYSLSLKEAYGKNSEARDFRIPGALLGELELNLQYAVRKTDVQHEEAETDYSALRRFFGELSKQLAHTALTSVAATTSSADTEDPEGLNLLLSQEQDLEKGFGLFLSRKIEERLNEQAAALVKPDGSLDTDLLIRNVMKTVDLHLLQNPDLEQLFEGQDGGLRQKARSNLSTMMTVLTAKRVRDYNFIRRKVFSTQEIIITADELKKVTAGAIQTLRIRVSPNGYLPDEPIINPEIPERP